MSHLATVSLPVALLVAALALLGAVLTLLGTIGLVRIRPFFDRLHAPTLGASWGTGAILLASAVLSVAARGTAPLREIVIGAIILVTSAATMVTLAGATLYRQQREDAAAAMDRKLAAGPAADGAAGGAGDVDRDGAGDTAGEGSGGSVAP